jgi:hypothetical protein
LLSRPSIPSAALLPKVSVPPRILLARAVAVTALVLLFSASAAVLMAGSAKPAMAPADAGFINARVIDVDQGVRVRLLRLSTTGGLARAQRKTRDAIAALNALARPVRAGGDPTSVLLGAAIADELRLLDAVGSVLMNPDSPKLSALAALDSAARRSVAALPGRPPHRKGGVKALLRWRDGRAGPAATPAGA